MAAAAATGIICRCYLCVRGACRDIPVSFSSLRLVGYSPQAPFLFQPSTTAEVGVSDPKRDFFLPFFKLVIAALPVGVVVTL
jgi:hypothetical protein